MWYPLTFECTNASNAFYVPVPFKCKVAAARYACDANQAATKSVVIAKTGGNTIISGDLSATAGTITEGSVSGTEAYANQEIDIDETLTITINLSSGTAGTVVMWLDLDEFCLLH